MDAPGEGVIGGGDVDGGGYDCGCGWLGGDEGMVVVAVWVDRRGGGWRREQKGCGRGSGEEDSAVLALFDDRRMVEIV